MLVSRSVRIQEQKLEAAEVPPFLVVGRDWGHGKEHGNFFSIGDYSGTATMIHSFHSVLTRRK